MPDPNIRAETLSDRDAPDDDIPLDAFMAIPLRAYDATLRGRVVFPPAFVV